MDWRHPARLRKRGLRQWEPERESIARCAIKAAALWHNQSANKLHAAALESDFARIELGSSSAFRGKGNLALVAVGKRNRLYGHLTKEMDNLKTCAVAPIQLRGTQKMKYCGVLGCFRRVSPGQIHIL